MNPNDTKSVVKVREVAHPPERVWRALTQTHLMEDWLMPNDFEPEVGHHFEFDAGWGKIIGEVLTAKPHETLVYTWRAAGLESTVTWTLIETETGTSLRMEQAGFVTGQERAYRGAKSGWEGILDRLETNLEIK